MPSEYSTRSRFKDVVPYKAQFQLATNAPTQHVGESFTWEEVFSRNNDWHHSSRSGADIGGVFQKKTFTDVRKTVPFDVLRPHSLIPRHAWGEHWAVPNVGRDQDPSHWSVWYDLTVPVADMDSAGTRFIAEASPSTPQAGLTVALTELKREGLPSLSSQLANSVWNRRGAPTSIKRKMRSKDLKKGSSDYLQWQFGWVPIVSDIRALAKSVMEADHLLSILYRNDGRLIRRRRGSSTNTRLVSETSTDTVGVGYPGFVSQMYPRYFRNGDRVRVNTKVTRSQWFSGAFMYHLPENVGPLGELRSLAVDARYLFGLSASPIDLWNLVPWSWLVDWFSTTGDVIQTFSDQIYNGQVLKYGYMMAHTTKQVSTEVDVLLWDKHIVSSALQTYDLKQRTQATPFGFGITWDGLSPYQMSIIAALGLSRR